jgi:lipid-A-disaccharide synthase
MAAAGARDCGVPVALVAEPSEKRDAFAACDAALAASGTVAVELAVVGVPAVIAYRANPISAAIVRRLVKVRFASLVNLTLDREATPELLQENCRLERMISAVDRLLTDPDARVLQKKAYAEAMAKLAVDGRPSTRAAAVALSMIAKKGV